ncbi:MAG: T9SS type A sorting domain-containing protein, partial [Bacteroidales bacterium]|nr:T9SS type A sorting domain-containing protein [Bacteroidales bacterium]
NSNVITVLGSTLPVELSAFTASYMENYTLIKWVTASETDVIGFNIYRSTEDVYDTSVKLNINHIQGQGTTTEPQYYEFQDIDQLVYETTYYYWLEVVNYCGSSNVYGSIEFTPETGQGGFENDFDSNLLMNQPNPFSSTTTINYAIKGMLKSEPVNISIYNTLGQLILTDVAKNGVCQFDASELPTGVYFYRLETGSYNQMNKMMVIK